MKKSLIKDCYREIKKTIKRFLSILVMAFLGVGFYAGIRASSVDMIKTLDDYYKSNNVYDFKVISTLGLTDEDIDYFKNIDEVKDINGSYSKDMIVTLNDKDIVSKIHSITSINSLNIKKGRLPKFDNECVVEQEFLDNNKIKLGDEINLNSNNFLNNDKLKIVGVVESPLYISVERGTSKLGSGSIDYFIYVDNKNIKSEYYTEMYITLKDSDKYLIDSKEYKEYIKEINKAIDKYTIDRSEIQYNNLVDKTKTDVNSTYKSMGIDITNINYDKYIKGIEKPNWYIYDRDDDTGYSGFIRDSESIENIGKVFPLVFFAIATLISLTSMTRMVEEQRVQIGTLKALGYKNTEIAQKYIIYSSLATIFGGILGMSIGFYFLPKILWTMYSAMYTMPSIICEFNFYIGFIGLGIAYLCITGSTIIELINELNSEPSILMRPKAPSVGKKIILEKIPFIWRRLNFTSKVTFRNIFRYKKRFLMTVVGIAGCTSLILAGFGLRDSVSDIVNNQYNNIFKYDMQTIVDTDKSYEINELINNLYKNKDIKSIDKANISMVSISNKNKEKDVYLVVVENEEEFSKIVNLNNKDKKINMKSDKIVISDKVSEILNIKKGNEIRIKDSNNKSVKIEVSDITSNYINHYAYVTKETYESIFNYEYKTNCLFLKNNKLSKKEERKLSENIINNDSVLSITLTSKLKTIMNDTLDSLNYVIWILIISAGLLAFVVLYNLSNINISERIRELSTIKVLGFYDREVYKYVTREMFLLIIIGILLGLFGGVFLTNFITDVAEIDIMKFGDKIHFMSYILSIIITILFNFIVNIFTYHSLKKIDMIESLKSIE